MEIGISIICDSGVGRKWKCIYEINCLLKENIKHKRYKIINHYWLVCQVCKTQPGFERFTAISRPRFYEHRHLLMLDKTYKDFYGVYTCEFKIDFEEYDAFVAATDEEAKRIIARKVVESLSNLDRLSRKAAGFDKERFKSDVIKLFKDNDLL